MKIIENDHERKEKDVAYLHNVGARQEHRVSVGALRHLIRLTSQGRLIDFEIVALNNNAISGQ